MNNQPKSMRYPLTDARRNAMEEIREAMAARLDHVPPRWQGLTKTGIIDYALWTTMKALRKQRED